MDRFKVYKTKKGRSVAKKAYIVEATEAIRAIFQNIIDFMSN